MARRCDRSSESASNIYSGLNLYEDFYIYTNRGLGTFWVRIRINCRPEISRFSLTHASAAEKRASPRPRSRTRMQPPRRRRVRRVHPKKVRARG